MRSLLLAFALFAGLFGAAEAQSSSDGSIRITAPWARATAAAATTGGAFLVIANTGSSGDELIAAATPVAATAELHRTETENGVVKMTPVSALDVMPGQKVALAPGGYHLMLTGLKSQLKEGESFPLTLTFEKAGKIDVMVKIEKAGAMGSDDMGGMNMN